LGQADGSFWLPPPSSTTAGSVDTLFYVILYVSAFFFLLIVSLMVLFAILYRRRPGQEAGPAPSHNTALEISWTVIPLIIVIVIFYMGFTGYMDIRTAPREALEIQVVGRTWTWLFRYPNGHVDENLHVPVEEPVRLVMTSEDVIHSLFIPRFRLKMDLVPGRYSTTWFRATEPGEYNLVCAEYCGTGHSDMLASVIVHESGEFRKWLDDASNFLKRMSPVDAGRSLYQARGCAQCHSTDGTALVGPSIKEIFGQTHQFTDGTSAEVDENYLRESIMEPAAKIRTGYPDRMPTYKGLLSDEEISAIIAFIKSLK
jgi:cytochrome c oxidase subunit 2